MNNQNIQELLQEYATFAKCDLSITNHSDFTVYTSLLQHVESSIDFVIDDCPYTLQANSKLNIKDLDLIRIACTHLISTSLNVINTDYLFSKLLDHSIQQDEIKVLSQHLKTDEKELCLVAIQYHDDLQLLLETVRISFEDAILLTPYNNYVLLLFSSNDDFSSICHELYNTITSELMIKIKVYYKAMSQLLDIEKVLNSLFDIERIANIYCPNRSIVSNKDLGISNIIALLNQEEAIHLFNDFSLGGFDELDNTEDIKTIYAFFENNLNIAETSRQLFIHRNTLVYRLDKYQKLTNLDIRRFDDATKFQLSFFIYQYYKK
ncbi:MAG: helix-turn-helix domain-containing protein [Anaerorhabdus sp.]